MQKISINNQSFSIRLSHCYGANTWFRWFDSRNGLIDYLKQHDIYVIIRLNTAAFMYGITYVDNRNKSVFNGSALGKQYAAKAIQDRILSINPSGAKNLLIEIPSINKTIRKTEVKIYGNDDSQK